MTPMQVLGGAGSTIAGPTVLGDGLIAAMNNIADKPLREDMVLPAAYDALTNKDRASELLGRTPGTAATEAPAHQELLAAVAKTGVEPQQLVRGTAAAEASGQVDPQVEQQAVENITKETGAPPEPGMWDKLTPGQKWLLGAGVGLAAIGLLTSLTDENGGGLGSTLAAVLGGTMALGAAAHGGMLGEGVQNATKAVTDPLLSSTNMQPVSRDQQQMLAAVRGADLDRYQQLRAGPNPNIPQIA